ncbi:putative O-glycosylation ligase, exosortase A system-associated [Falsiroseomonas sp. E2-1-a20]|uniref:putative O-glycosylation ligase, exosortase A system-associated n=1 Tax=Falsiroseomonas sp. E2-1-a20 TaxID=3239300 RepID=UPI003F2B7B26
MRDAVLLIAMLALLPMSFFKPFVGVLLWCWISFMNPHRLVYGFAGGIPWAALVFMATVAGCVLSVEARKPVFNAVTWLLIAFLLCITMTTAMAIAAPDAAWAKYSQVSKVILGLLLTSFLLTDRWRIHALVWIMVISVGYFGVRGGIFAIITGGSYRIWGPPNTMISDNNHLAAGMLVTLPLMNYLRMQSRHHLIRLGLAFAMGLTLLATISSYSRGALLGLVAMLAVLWWRSQRKMVAALVLPFALAGAIAFMPAAWFERMETIGTYEEDRSATGRLDLWAISWKLAVQNPITGSGFTGPYNQRVVDTVEPGGPARAVHSIWFELLGEHGFITFFVWCGLLVAGAIYAQMMVGMARNRPELRWAYDLGRMSQVSLVAYVVSGTFLSLSYWDFLWTLLVVIGAGYGLARRQMNPEVQPAWRQAGAAATRTGWRTA